MPEQVNPVTGIAVTPQQRVNPTVKGEKAGQSFDSSSEVERKARADRFRVQKKKSFAWQPPKAKGIDPEWDAFNAEEDKKKPVTGGTPLTKTGM